MGKGRLVEKERGCTREGNLKGWEREKVCETLCQWERQRDGREASARSIRGQMEGRRLLATTTLTAHSILEAVMQNNVSYPHELEIEKGRMHANQDHDRFHTCSCFIISARKSLHL